MLPFTRSHAYAIVVTFCFFNLQEYSEDQVKFVMNICSYYLSKMLQFSPYSAQYETISFIVTPANEANYFLHGQILTSPRQRDLAPK